MELTSTLNVINTLLSKTTADFQKHLDINTLCWSALMAVVSENEEPSADVGLII